MRCYFIVVLLSLSIALPAYAGTAPAHKAGGLACFTIPIPKISDPKNHSPVTCDELCAKKNAACVSLKIDGAINPGFGCDDPLDPLRGAETVSGCRCCALAP